MTAPPSTLTTRDTVDALLARVARLAAAAVTLRSAAADVRGDGSTDSLLSVLDAIERDLLLATREAGRVRLSVAT